MSKKKLQRAVMTLKDFHGGSIPSDLPLPSAPGMAVERSSFDRQGSGARMSPVGRGYGGGSERSSMSQNRQGLGSSGVRAFEDKTSLFPNPANIGRNYDEDERSKPVDGCPHSSSTEQYEEHVKVSNPRSLEEEHGYKGMMAPVSYAAIKPKPPISPPPHWRQQPPQQPPAAAADSVDCNSGANVWPAQGQESSNRMPAAELVRSQRWESASWPAAQTPKPKTLDLAMMPNKESSRTSWKPEHSYGGTTPSDPQGHGHGSGNPLEHPNFSRQQSMYRENMEQVGYAQADVSQTDRKLVYGETYASNRGADSNDGIISGFVERHIIGESTRVQGGYPDTGGYVHDSGGDGLNGNGAIVGWGGYQDPGRRMKFFEKGRIGRVESDYIREPSDPKSLQQADRGIRADNPGVGNDNHALYSGYGASLPERNPNSSNPHESWTQQVNLDQGDRAPGGRNMERRRSPPLVESNQAFVKERSVPSAGGYLAGFSQIEAPSAASGPQVPLVTPEPVAERPKLKLLPRSKPLGMNEAVEHIGSEVLALQKEKDSNGKSDERQKDELTTEGKVAEAVDGSGHLVKGPSSNFESGDLGSKLAERPKLNLKPRSQPLEEGAAPAGSDRVRDSVFGGARPREFVLRARGANDMGTVGEDCILPPPSLHIGHIPDSVKSKPQQQTGGHPGGSNSWGDEKQVQTQSFEQQAEGFMESQGPGFRERKVSKQDWVAPSKHLGNPEWKSHGDFDKQDNPGQYEVNHSYNHYWRFWFRCWCYEQ